MSVRRKMQPAGKPFSPTPEVLMKGRVIPEVVTIPQRNVLELAGRGAPGGPAFQEAIKGIFSVAYTLAFARKKSGKPVFRIGPLEARWWGDQPAKTVMEIPPEEWHWELRVGLPESVQEAEVAKARESAQEKRGESEALDSVRRMTVPEMRMVRMLHVGPYAEEARTFRAMTEHLAQHGFAASTRHIEVYLSDPRRTKPERLRTMLLLEIAERLAAQPEAAAP